MNAFQAEKKLVRVGNYIMTDKVLGKGHFARVEEAIHRILNVKVAVKIINITQITDQYIKKNLKREAIIMSKILHPNIICLMETLQSERNYYLVTELGAGGDLCEFIRQQKNGKLNEKKSQLLAKQLTSAVKYLHSKEIIHRDLKMENILLNDRKDQVKLTDFGLSNFCKPEELLRTHCGSPEYAAPELYIRGRLYGPEVDIWSLGVVFYGMIVGKLPFQVQKKGLTPDEKRKQLMAETSNGITLKHKKALIYSSHVFRDLIGKMLNPNSNERITMKNLLQHSWLFGLEQIEFSRVSRCWHRKTIAKIAKALEIKDEKVLAYLKKNGYGPLGGIYNIEKLKYYTKLYEYRHSIPNSLKRKLKLVKSISSNTKQRKEKILKTKSRENNSNNYNQILQNTEQPKKDLQFRKNEKTNISLPVKTLNKTPKNQEKNHITPIKIKNKYSTNIESKLDTILDQKLLKVFNTYKKQKRQNITNNKISDRKINVVKNLVKNEIDKSNIEKYTLDAIQMDSEYIKKNHHHHHKSFMEKDITSKNLMYHLYTEEIRKLITKTR